MLQIRALNEDPEDSCSSTDTELKVTGEAEETIVVSEYLKALTLKSSNQKDNALFLFLELLETEVLVKLNNDKDNKLLLVKYNCYRNAGLIYHENNEDSLALHYLIKAVELDETDVHTMFCLAKLALKMGQIHVAKMYYEKCIERNPNHWPSLDGLLQVFCASENIIEAYSWAMQCYMKDNTYKRAINVLTEIDDRFNSTVPFLEELFTYPIKLHSVRQSSPAQAETGHFCSKFSETVIVQEDGFDYEPYKVDKLNWLVLGELILRLYTDVETASKDFLLTFNLDDFLGQQPNINSVDHNMEEQILIVEDDDATHQYEILSINNTDSAAETEAKSRRRGSELKILEQWGWHKNRRSSRKKSVYDVVDPIESTADAFLKRTLSEYFQVFYETGISPFSESRYVTQTENIDQVKDLVAPSHEQFNQISRVNFDTLIAELQSCEFDLYILIYRYLHYLSLYWNECIPKELRNLYIQVYVLFKKYDNYQFWNQLESTEILSMFRITMFYLELRFDHLENDAANVKKSELEWEFRNILQYLQLYTSFLPEKDYLQYHSRYLWLAYSVSLYENELSIALNNLIQIETLIAEQSEVLYVRLPNQQFHNFYSLRLIQDSISLLKRKISLSNVKKLYSEQKYQELVDILKDSLINAPEILSLDSRSLNITTQIEILLECLWNLEEYMDCILWSEKALKYTVDAFILLLNDSYRQKIWAKTINFILIYILSLIQKEGSEILIFENTPRVVQSIHKILTNQLDAQVEKHPSHQYMVDCWRAWAILYYILEQQDEKNMIYRKNRGIISETSVSETEEETLFSSIMMFFVAHELLGRRQWCSKGGSKLLFMMLDIIVPKLRSPMLEPYRDIINECLEQTTYCLYGYPHKKGRMRHIQDHEATPEQLTWERAIQLFDIYRPDVLPEFNSYKIDSVSADMEALLQHILLVLPENKDVSPLTGPITDFINGKESVLPKTARKDLLCFKMKSIYYLLADYYFKSRDFTKAIKYYVMDLTIEPTRFDSWAGISLSKASKCETLLNSTEILRPKEFLSETSNAIKCFEQCLKVNDNDPQLWVEYGSFAYNIQSYCSRSLKLVSNTASIDSFAFVEAQREYYVNIAYKSFNEVNIEHNDADFKDERDSEDTGGHEDEKWLYHYMLGKIAEKKNEQPTVYLTHYLKSAKFLYECNATYPIKVNHSNPSQLSVEALEVFYRTNAAIIKYTEQHSSICKQTAGLFKRILKELAVSPFAVNRAKINDVAFKRKLTGSVEQTQESIIATQIKSSNTTNSSEEEIKCDEKAQNEKDHLLRDDGSELLVEADVKKPNDSKVECPSRRVSQESTAATTTTTTSNGTSSGSSSSDSPNSALDFSSDSDTDSTTDDEAPITPGDRDAIFKDCIKNLEECITRFPEHYKSIYRLAYHYMNAPGATKSLERCRELLLGSYKTALGNQIAGLFTERRSNNFFNGIWRIPSSDIDRPGSFASHLSKCVVVLMETLKRCNDHETLLDLAIQLYRTPDADKKYLNDCDRKELFQQAVLFCVQVYQNTTKNLAIAHNDGEMLSLLVEIFKAYRRCIKHMPAKEGVFSNVLVEAYKMYIHGKAKLPDNANTLDLAVKLCTYEINYRKTMDKMTGVSKPPNPGTESASTMITPMQPISVSYIPGLTKLRRTTVTKGPSNVVTSPALPVVPSTKYIPMGPSTIVSASLPGLTITPVNVLNSMPVENKPKTNTQPSTPSSSFLSSNTTSLFANFSNPKAVAELSKMYFQSLSNMRPADTPFDYNRFLADRAFASSPVMASVSPRNTLSRPSADASEKERMDAQ